MSGIKILNKRFSLIDLWRLRHSLLSTGLRVKRLAVFLNLIKILLSKLFRKTNITGFPYMAMIEPSSRCNLHCPMCGLTIFGLRERSYRDMTFIKFEKVFNELEPYLLNIAFWNFGEPLMNKNIFRMIEYAHRKNIFSIMTTNGTLLYPSKAKELIASGLDYLVISMDGANANTYEQYRKGGKFDTLITNIRFLISEKIKQKKLNPFVEVSFLIMKDNEDEMEKMKELACDLGINKLTFKKVSFSYDSGQSKYVDINLFLPRNAAFQHPVSPKDYNKKRHCRSPWETIVVSSDGSIIPCCQDLLSMEKMGNIFNDSLKSIWLGKNYRDFRKRICENINNIELCRYWCSERDYTPVAFSSMSI